MGSRAHGQRSSSSLRAGACALVILAAACGGTTDDPAVDSAGVDPTTATENDAGDGDDAGTEGSSDSADPRSIASSASSGSDSPTTTESSSGTESSEAESSPGIGPRSTPDADAIELRTWLGADRLVLRTDAGLIAASDRGAFEVSDSFPGVFADYIFDDGAVVDYAGQPACTGFELVGDFAVIDEITGGDTAVVIVEDRRAMATDTGSGTTEVPRFRHDCATSETVEVPSTSSVESTPDASIVTTTTPGGLVLVTEWGLGDTPLRLATGDGTVLIESDAIAYDYLLSPDEGTVYATTYAGTGAASPPDGVIAIDVDTGTELWRRDVGGFVWSLQDRLVIEEVDTQLNDLGIFDGREIVTVDPTTGADLDRMALTDRIVGLF